MQIMKKQEGVGVGHPKWDIERWYMRRSVRLLRLSSNKKSAATQSARTGDEKKHAVMLKTRKAAGVG
jgi:hypothetical protein